MAVEKRVLVVSPTQAVARAVTANVRRTGYIAIVVKSFAEAKKQLGLAPHLLITELKLGEFNGLHLALRAMACEIPSIVIADPTFEHEVEQLGACWSATDAAASDEMQTVMLRLVQGVGGDSDFWPENPFEGRGRATPPRGAQLH